MVLTQAYNPIPLWSSFVRQPQRKKYIPKKRWQKLYNCDIRRAKNMINSLNCEMERTFYECVTTLF